MVPAFWTQLLYFIRLPFSAGIFSALAVFAGFGLLLPETGTEALVFRGIYGGVILMMLFELTNLLAEGRTDIPTLQEIWAKGEPFLLVRLLVQIIFVSVLIISIDKPWFTLGLLIIYGLGFPASVIILALEKRFFSAVNPFRIIYVITAIRLPYFILYGSWLLIVLATFKLYTLQQSSHLLITFISLQLSFYLWTVWFSMLGYAIYQYHQQLGIAVAPRHKHHRHQQSRQKNHNMKSAVITEAEILIKEQRLSDAFNLLSTAMNDQMIELDVYRYYLNLLVEHKEERRLKNSARHLVRQFIHQNKPAEAVNVTIIAKSLIPTWSPDLATDCYLVAEGLIQMGRRDYALSLLSQLMSQDEKPELMAKVYFEIAKLLAENFNKDKQAIDCLETIITRYSSEPIAEEALAYQQILKASISDSKYDSKYDSEDDSDGDALIIRD